MQNGVMALERLCDPRSKVSAHYLIEEDGRVFHLVDEASRAWHAGLSFWRGEKDVNSHSIGIELVNPGHEFGYRPFPAAQMEALRALCLDIKNRRDIPAENFLAHSDIAPMRRQDPGEWFDWKGLATHGIGIWPEPGAEDDAPMTAGEAAAHLARVGYVPPAGEDELRRTLLAFQRHYDPKNLSGAPDGATPARLRALCCVLRR